MTTVTIVYLEGGERLVFVEAEQQPHGVVARFREPATPDRLRTFTIPWWRVRYVDERDEVTVSHATAVNELIDALGRTG